MRPLINTSTIFESVVYDRSAKILELELSEGGTWYYFNFSPAIYKKFIESGSMEQFFLRNIKGKYIALRVG